IRRLVGLWRLQALDGKRVGVFRFQIDDPNRVIVCIGDVKFVAGDRQTSRLVKRRSPALSFSRLSRSRVWLSSARRRIEQLDLVIVSIGNQQLVIPSCETERML